MDYKCDITIAGAGPAGMIAMLSFARAGFSVIGIERAPKSRPKDRDLRSTAFLQPALSLLQSCGVWDALAPHATPLEVMEIVDGAQMPPKSVAFRADEIGKSHFGQNILNAPLLEALQNAIEADPQITMIYETSLESAKQFSEGVELRLTSGVNIQTRLLVGADGRNSSVRGLMGAQPKIKHYDQKALVFCVEHEHPHNNISSEIHDFGGPFTTVPIADIKGSPASAIVWMDKTSESERRAELAKADFEVELNARSQNWRGAMKLSSKIGAFPMILMSVDKLHNHRMVLIGEAAHVVPPIGAQGLNMSLRDIEKLVRAAETGGLTKPEQFSNWARARKADLALRKRGIDALNQVSIAGFSGALSLREYGLRVLERPTPIRRGLMCLGLG